MDSSAPALALAATQPRAQRLHAARLVEADVFTHLRLLRDRAERFDLIVADPPKLARKHLAAQAGHPRRTRT